MKLTENMYIFILKKVIFLAICNVIWVCLENFSFSDTKNRIFCQFLQLKKWKLWEEEWYEEKDINKKTNKTTIK